MIIQYDIVLAVLNYVLIYHIYIMNYISYLNKLIQDAVTQNKQVCQSVLTVTVKMQNKESVQVMSAWNSPHPPSLLDK